MGLARRWWRWLRGAVPLQALPARPAAAVAAWSGAFAATAAVEALSPLPFVPLRAALPLAAELALVAALLRGVRRPVPWAQALQAAGLLAALRNLALAPVLLLLAAGAVRAPPPAVLALFALVAVSTAAAMAWLLRRYLALWREALGIGARGAGLLLLGLACALLLVEAGLGAAPPA